MDLSPTLHLDALPTAPSAARRWAARALDDLGCAALEEVAVLLLSELVTNAVLHARTPIDVRLLPHREGVRIEVRDGSPAGPTTRRHSVSATTGRGVALLSRLAGDWGWRPDGDGKVVWFTVTEDGDPWAGVDATDLLEQAL